MATVTTSIGSGTGHSETVTISSVSGSGPYTVTLSATVPSTVVLGDALYDEAATPNKYLITGISGSDLTVEDSTGVGAAPDDTSGASTPVIERYYNGSTPITDWESELDDTNLYPSNPDAVGECYNDAAFDESVTINGGNTSGLASVKLTVASTERHDGTAGTGAEIVASTGRTITFNDPGNNPDQTIEWLSIDENGNAASHVVTMAASSGVQSVNHLLIHDLSSSSTGVDAIEIENNGNAQHVHNNIIYDILSSHTGSGNAAGIIIQTNFEMNVLNNTVHAVTNNGGSGTSYGILVVDDVDGTYQNNLVTDTGGTTSGTVQDYSVSSPSNATMSYNLSSDTTASGTGSLTSKTAANQFVSTTAGSEDLHLKTDADAISVGTDLAATPSGVEIDIDGYDRNANARGYSVSWDIGAVEYKSVTLSIGQGTDHDQMIAITASSGSGEYSVTMASAGTDVVNGDALWDEHATPRKYLIVDGAGTTSLTVVDMEGIGSAPDNSGTSSSAIKRYYNGSTPITDWDSELDDTNIYQANDNALGKCYNDGTFSESPTVNGGGTVGLYSRVLEAATGEQHDGTDGAGVVADGLLTISVAPTTVRNMVWGNVNNNGDKVGIDLGTGANIAERCIVRDVTATSQGWRAQTGIDAQDNTAIVLNCIIYNIAGTTGRGTGIASYSSTKTHNCTVHYVRSDGATSGNCYSNGTLKNCLGTDAYNDDYAGSPTMTTCMSSDATGSSGLQNVTTADQFVSTTSGSEDLHLKSGADAIGAGTDLASTPSGVEVDIDGYDRDANARGHATTWDIGADQYQVITVSIGQGTGHDQNVNIVSSSGGPEYSVTLAAAGTDVVNGDALWDEHATPRKYLIVDGAGTTSLTVIDAEGIGSAPDFSATSTPQIKRYYNGTTPLIDWESELDDTDKYEAGTNAVGHCYNDAAFGDELTIDGGGTVGLSSILLTVPSSERHDGTAGSGARNIASVSSGSSPAAITLDTLVTLEWLEVTADKSTFGGEVIGVKFGSNSSTSTTRYMIIHDLDSTAGGIQGNAIRNQSWTNDIHNIIGYNSDSANANSGRFWVSSAGSNHEIYNCTAHSFDTYGYELSAGGATTTNCIGTDNGTSDFSGSFSGDYNMGSDTSAPGANSVDNAVSSSQFVSTTGGSEDLHLKTGSDAIDAGTDLGTTPSGVEIDIDGRDRDANGDTWDIGAHELVVAASQSSAPISRRKRRFKPLLRM